MRTSIHCKDRSGPNSQHGDNVTGRDTDDQAISGPRTTAGSRDSGRLAELAASVEIGFGRSLDAPMFDALAIVQVELWKTRETLETILRKGDLYPEIYLERLNSAIELSMRQSLRVLGRERFEAIFGEAGRNPETLTWENS
jgi:hypothetical protein